MTMSNSYRLNVISSFQILILNLTTPNGVILERGGRGEEGKSGG